MEVVCEGREVKEEQKEEEEWEEGKGGGKRKSVREEVGCCYQ